MWKNLPLIFTLIIAISSNFAFTTTPSGWKGDELLPFQDASGHLIGTYSNQSLNERAATCNPGYYQCAGSSLCCSSLCGSICSSSTCCEALAVEFIVVHRPLIVAKIMVVVNQVALVVMEMVVVNQVVLVVEKIVVSQRPPFVVAGLIVAQMIFNVVEMVIVVQNTNIVAMEFQASVLKLAKDNNYNDEEANKVDETAKQLIDCVNNFGMSLVKAGLQKNNSCISCDQANTLSDFNTNSTPSTEETLAMLKLFYSIEQAMVDATKYSCSQSNTSTKSSQDTLTSGYNSNSVSNSLITIGIILSLTIMNLHFVYGDTLISQFFPPPDFVKEAAEHAIHHNECRFRLRKTLANIYSPLLNRILDPETEILISAGASEGLYSTFAGFLDNGDEVILFEPFYDQYILNITMNGGVPIYVPLRPQGNTKDKLDMNELRSKLTKQSKIIVLNTPHNPIGKVFSIEEITEISKIAQEFNLLIVSDEVYDRLYYEQNIHKRIANIPKMWERTITLGSCSKTFGVTVLAAHTRIVFCVNSPFQDAIATSLEKAEQLKYYETNRKQYEKRREKLMKALSNVELPYTIPQGSFFILVNISKIRIPSDYQYPPAIEFRPKDYKVCYWMAKEIGIIAIPSSEFHCEKNKQLAHDYVRFAFCKTDETLNQAAIALQKLKNYIDIID
ncbi:10063_t:CDS:10 [Dentiscutata erythropus]|uniref:10063_t:CDS:1 n=1 Tax=Dentiscutata erythropus TaxID=1348616 RepID=A0A9N9F1H1_9GLOM|nr:10063_t:CDS:10 [Dentiscutata erythropus]